MKLTAVIGANYGDEGKGRVVDYFSNKGSLVVRFNGGAQAGHTVVTKVGRRHVFRHFGSGTFKNAPTYLSRHFIVNPVLFRPEYQQLYALALDTNVVAHPECIVTTPWDMFLNQSCEKSKCVSHRGSCGCGINETVVRNQSKFKLTLRDLSSPNLPSTLFSIKDEWVPHRVSELGLSYGELSSLIREPEWAYRFLDDCRFFLKKCRVLPLHEGDTSPNFSSFPDAKHVIFEGAQGLRLDELGRDFPFVTRSRTGLPNVLDIIRKEGFNDTLDVVYVTRPYLTRHGAGPLNNELTAPPYAGITERTNVFNANQGPFRYAWLDIDALARTTKEDLSLATDVKTNPKFAITCLDQMPRTFSVIAEGKLVMVTAKKLASMLSDRTGIEVCMMTPPPSPI